MGGGYSTVKPVDLHGKVAIVTGANTGIGVITAKELARMGAEVILACRSLSKAKEAQKLIQQETENDKVHVMELDLSSLKSVRKFVEDFKARKSPLHLLINNAGHFLLTNLLLPNIKESAPARIINVSSSAHYMGKLDFNDLQSEKSYSSWGAYHNSKLANVLFTKELQNRLKGTNVFAYSLHPGFIKTELARDVGTITAFLLSLAVPLFAKTPEQGAQTTLYCAVSPEVEGVGGKYYDSCKEKQPSAAALDSNSAKKLWEVSEQLVGL